MNYLALGDSISIDDYTEVEGGGVVNQFARLLRAVDVQDFTQDGRTTNGVLADLERVTLAPDVVTLIINRSRDPLCTGCCILLSKINRQN